MPTPTLTHPAAAAVPLLYVETTLRDGETLHAYRARTSGAVNAQPSAGRFRLAARTFARENIIAALVVLARPSCAQAQV